MVLGKEFNIESVNHNSLYMLLISNIQHFRP